MQNNQPLAVFDIDGTVFRWQLFHELVSELGKQGLFPQEVAQNIEEKFFKWRALQASWSDYENEIVNAIQTNIVEIPPSKLNECAQIVIDRSGHKVYNYTSDLAKKLKSDGYYLLAITGSQQEIAELFAKKHGFDKCIGSVMKKDNHGNFTKEYDRFVIGNKSKILQQFANENNFSLSGSYAVGDSEGDSQILEMATYPIAFNPDDGLLKIAQANNWPVVIERKNLAYTLSPNNSGEYYLTAINKF
ncbi:HAD-IB family phosphatase [Candidatus Saccharibacteria bacterium]|jgi:HAD superfamily hydrolase (TIGR01490 family)|nr:HAD-IB family phosphatase [Candidatus Saccharibacteria bacterium]